MTELHICRQVAGSSCGRHSLCHTQGLYYDWSARLCYVGSGNMELPPHQTADFMSVYQERCKKRLVGSSLAASALRTLV